MSTPTLINPQGVLKSGDVVYLVTYYNNSVYAFTTAGEFVEMSAFDNTTVVVPFTLTTFPDYITLTNGSSSLYYNNTGIVTYSTSGTNRNVYIADGFFEPLQGEVTSGILYFASGTQTGGTSLFPLSFSIDGSDAQIKISLVPANYYVNCSSQTNNTPQTGVNQILSMYGHSYNPTKYPNSAIGWTNQLQCFQGNQFNYCLAGSPCTGNCFSACSEGLTCTYKGSSTYSCNHPTPRIVLRREPVVQTSQRSYWWIILIIVGIVVVGLLIWFFFSSPDEPPVRDYHYSNHTLVS